ncbi:MAG: nitroreductase family protein [Acidimicrobiales bacterium]|nr:nitroreductase family protein [Acidimicrobiales bacterium]
MELYDAMRTTPSCRYFTDEPVDPAVLHRIFDNARFASSGGNRQGWRTVVVTDPARKAALAALHRKQWDPYVVHAREGVVGYNEAGRMAAGDAAQRRLDRTDDFSRMLAEVPVLLVCCVELATLAVTDKELDRQSIVGGGSLYTFIQNVLLGCRNEGLGSALTTLLCAEEPAVAELLGIPEGFAVGALVAVGHPVPEKQYTRLTRKPVEEIVFLNGWGEPFTG